MSIAIFPDNETGLQYASMLNGHIDVKLYGDSSGSDADIDDARNADALKHIAEENVILCRSSVKLLETAIYKGKNVLYPFPLPCCVHEISRLLDQHDAYLVAGSIERYYCDRQDIHAIIQNGRIGVVGVANITRKSSEPAQLLFSLLAREVDLLINLFGRIRQVYVMKRQSNTSALVLATLRFTDRTIVNIEVVCGYQGKTYEKGEFCGTEGIVQYDSRHQSPYVHVHDNSAQDISNRYLLANSEPYFNQVADFVMYLRAPDGRLKDLERHEYLSIVMSAMEESAVNNREVKI